MLAFHDIDAVRQCSSTCLDNVKKFWVEHKPGFKEVMESKYAHQQNPWWCMPEESETVCHERDKGMKGTPLMVHGFQIDCNEPHGESICMGKDSKADWEN